ncbi:MAG: PmoA family protein [bacterium]
MIRMIKAVMVGALAVGASAAQAQELKAVTVGSRIDVTVDGAFFTSYRFSAEEKYPFFFPVNGPSGASVTSMRNGEYPHHSSLFFGCDQVNGGNYWQEGLERGRIVSQGAVLEKATGNEIVIKDTCDWTRPDAEQPLRDTRRIAVSAPSKGLRQIDFDVTLEALAEVTIKKTNHSFFSGRVDPDLSVRCGGTMINAQDERGEKGTFGKASPWMACYGRRGAGAVEGMAILQHPSNPWYPAPWFTRDYGFFSPTPMYWPKDGVATKLAKGEKLTLRYRVLVFAGDHKEAGVSEKFVAYAGGAASLR